MGSSSTLSSSAFFAFPRSRPKQISLLLLAAAFTYVGVHHFVAPAFYVSIMPDYMPWHLELVYISGVFEVMGGLGLLWGRTRRIACWGLLALLVAVYPANINMLMNPEKFPDIPYWALWVRMPLQFLAAAWIWYATRPDPSTGSSGARPQPA